MTAAAANGKVKSADRVMAVLDLVAERGSLGFSGIAAALELPKSSAHALLRTMESRGYLALEPERREYRLGTRIWELAQVFHGIEDLRTLMKPLMNEVVAKTGETVQLAMLEGVSAVYLGLSESPHPMKLTSRAGARRRLHERDRQGAARQHRARGGGAPARRRYARAAHAHTITSVPTMLEELERVRRQGYGSTTRSLRSACAASPGRCATSTTR